MNIGAAVLVFVGGFLAWKHFSAERTPPPGVITPKTSPKAPTAGATPAPGILAPVGNSNALAHAPITAIKKAEEAVAARRASGQTGGEVTAGLEDLPAPPPTSAATPEVSAVSAAPAMPALPAVAPTAKVSSAMTSLAPGLAASTQVETAFEASPAFRSFVANAKVSGVFQGTPPRAFINGRMLRVGDTAEAALGIVFDGVVGERRQLIFKDKSGATVARKY